MRIVFVIDQVYLHGGIERVLSIKANYFAEIEGNEVHIITTEQKNEVPCYPFSDKIIFEDLGVNYRRKKSYFHPVNLKRLPRHIRQVKSTLKKIAPDVVVVCSHSTDTYFIPFINKKIPKVKEFHFSKFIEVENRKNPRSLIKKYFFKFADYVESKYDKLIILNSDESQYYKTNNTSIIPNPLTFYPEKISGLSNNIVITAGRIAPVKGYDLLIDIWELFYRKNKDWELHVYGNGDANYIEKLQNTINKKGLQNNVVLKGPTDDVKGKMLSSSLFVMSSHNECFPLVLLEAQACGLPIVSFDCPHGPRNIISEQNGILIELYNKDEFAQKLLELVENPDLLKKKGYQARENAGKYSIEKVMNLWQEMFNDVILN